MKKKSLEAIVKVISADERAKAKLEGIQDDIGRASASVVDCSIVQFRDKGEGGIMGQTDGN